MIRLIEAVAQDPDRLWKENTRDQFVIDANAILEALLAETGVEATLAALKRQGFRGHYRQVVEPLYREAISRRDWRQRGQGNLPQ
jgi:hypothetical protein